MQGSLYPNGVLVDCSALRRTEITKAAEILRNRVDWTSRGVYSGGVVTPNGVDANTVDVAQLSGFCPNGEYIETTQDYTKISLDDYTSGTDNYVCAVYTEVEDRNQPHETDGLVHPTRSSMYYRIRVYSETNYGLLLPTDANLSNDARDRMIVLAIVNANGPAPAVLTTSDITLPTVYNNLMYSDPVDLHTITGVTITGVSSGTEMGTGSILYEYAVGPTYSLTWTSPTGGAGAVVNPTVDGSYTLSDGVGEYIVVDVVISQLPLVVPIGGITENIEIYNLYYQQVSRQTAEDSLHRNMIGTGIISPNNPHGLSYDDLYGSDASLLEEHRDVEHCNGIWRGSSVNIFFPSIVATLGGDTLSLIAPAAGDLYFINGVKLDHIEQTSIQFIPANVPASVSGTHFFEIYVTDTGDFEVLDDTNQPKASYPPGRTMTGTWISDMSPSYPAGNYVFSDTVAGTVHTLQWDWGQTVSIDALTAPSQMIRLYDYSGINWVDVWVNTSGAGGADATLPPGSVNDSITVNASPDWDQNMQIYSIPGWYDPVNLVFKLGTNPYDAALARSIIDKKPWGTLCVENMADAALQQLNYHPLDELQHSGVLLRRNGDYNEFDFSNPGAPSAVIEITGGSYYCRGRRLVFDGGSITFTDASKRLLVYVDWKGDLQYLNVTDDFAGDLQDAMRYVLGSTKYIPDVIEDIHESDEFDPPERGVLLYIVDTDPASDVSDYIDVRRNVNGPVDSWSVADFAYSADAVSAAFDNLYAAFAYAAFYQNYQPKFTDGITITVVGETTLDRSVEQPAGVNVVGTIGSNSLVNCIYSSVTGAWTINDGCSVKGMGLNLSITGAFFEIGGDNCAVEGCIYTNTGVAGADYVAYYGAARDNFKFIGNNVSTSGGVFLNLAAPALSSRGFFVVDNVITQNAIYGDGELLRIVGLANTVFNNTVFSLTSVGSSFYTGCILAYGCFASDISNNTIAIGGRDGTTQYSYGIGYNMAGVDSTIASTIKGNKISLNSGSTSDVDIGIYVMDGCNSLIITDNTISGCGIGIYTGGYYRNTTITNNTILLSKSKGISINVDRMTDDLLTGLSIDNNIIDGVSSGLTAAVPWSIHLSGIYVSVSTAAVIRTRLEQLGITNNKINNVINTTLTGNSEGVGVVLVVGNDHDSGQVRICGNEISNIKGDIVGASASSGISIVQLNANSYANSFKINDNLFKTETFATLATQPVQGVYLEVYALKNSSISNNSVYIYSSSSTAYYGSGILVNFSTYRASDLVISENTITCPWVGMFLRVASSVVCDNVIKTGSMGLACLSLDYSNVDDNYIEVSGYNDNPYHSAGIGSSYNHCIALLTHNTGFSIRNNTFKLLGTGTPLTIKSGATMVDSSSSVWITECKHWTVQNNKFYQSYEARSGAEYPSHLYASISSDYSYFDIKGNTIYNDLPLLPVSQSNGIYVEYIPLGAPGFEWCIGHIGDNTFMCSIPENLPIGIPAWNAGGDPLGGTAPPYELFLSDIEALPGRNYVSFTGNSLHVYGVQGVDHYIPRVYITSIAGFGGTWNGTNYAPVDLGAVIYWW